MNESRKQASQPRLTSNNVLKNTILLTKFGKFQVSYKEDAIILSFLLKYKINENFRVGFPESALTKVINILDEKKINYQITSKVKKFIFDSEKLLCNIPRYDFYNRDRFRNDITEVLHLVYLANITENKEIKKQYQFDILARISMID